jgi:hypothetical protein
MNYKKLFNFNNFENLFKRRVFFTVPDNIRFDKELYLKNSTNTYTTNDSNEFKEILRKHLGKSILFEANPIIDNDNNIQGFFEELEIPQNGFDNWFSSKGQTVFNAINTTFNKPRQTIPYDAVVNISELGKDIGTCAEVLYNQMNNIYTELFNLETFFIKPEPNTEELSALRESVKSYDNSKKKDCDNAKSQLNKITNAYKNPMDFYLSLFIDTFQLHNTMIDNRQIKKVYFNNLKGNVSKCLFNYIKDNYLLGEIDLTFLAKYVYAKLWAIKILEKETGVTINVKDTFLGRGKTMFGYSAIDHIVIKEQYSSVGRRVIYRKQPGTITYAYANPYNTYYNILLDNGNTIRDLTSQHIEIIPVKNPIGTSLIEQSYTPFIKRIAEKYKNEYNAIVSANFESVIFERLYNTLYNADTNLKLESCLDYKLASGNRLYRAVGNVGSTVSNVSSTVGNGLYNVGSTVGNGLYNVGSTLGSTLGSVFNFGKNMLSSNNANPSISVDDPVDDPVDDSVDIIGVRSPVLRPRRATPVKKRRVPGGRGASKKNRKTKNRKTKSLKFE